ncbi:MAG: VPLPA-CTERM sorting domain-containing protein [Gammaproteobacteria bacterium]
MRTYAGILAAGFFTLAAATSAQAETYYLNQTNLTASGYSDGVPYIKVDISKPTSSEIQFTVTPQSPISGALLMGFGFNTTGTSITTSQIQAPTGWTASGSGRDDGFGIFQFNLNADHGNNSRVSQLTFDIAGVSSAVTPLNFFANSTGAAGEQNVAFVAHVANLGNGLTGYFGGPAPVPVPAALWLFGSGLVGLVGVARRRSGV